jgi:predicted phosphate transport protein (TIGR00153 family)
VRFSLRPTDSTFYDLFAESAQNLVTGANLLAELFQVDTDRPALAKRMRDTEHQGDEFTHAIVRRVNTTFVTPFDREDIYRLAAGLDDVMDFMDEAVDLVTLYEIDKLPGELAKQVEVIQRAAELTAEAMPRLRTMHDLEDYWIEINRLENEADQVHRRLLATLFSGMYEPMEVLKLKDVVEELEAAADAFEHLAHAVQTIAAKEA